MTTRAHTHKDARIDLRINSEQKEVIGCAAAASGMNVSQWALDRPMRSTQPDLLEQSTLRVSTRAFDEFIRALEKPQAEEFASFVCQQTIWEG